MCVLMDENPQYFKYILIILGGKEINIKVSNFLIDLTF